MSKGNLYTRLVRKDDLEISIKTKLKHEFKKPIRDWKAIRKLRNQLADVQKKKRTPKKTIEQEYGVAFAWKIREQQKQKKTSRATEMMGDDVK